MKRVLFACVSLLVLSLTCVRVDAETYAGTWSAQAGPSSSSVHLRLEYRHVTSSGDEEWNESRDVPLSQLRGVGPADFASGGERKSFTIVRDAGEMRADGWFAGGNASGSWTFVPSANFVSELARRGIAPPSERQQFLLAMSDFKISTLDDLLRSGFERPTADDLVAMIEHGVTNDYIASVKDVPLHPKNVRELIRMRDHGIDARYAAQVTAYLPGITDTDLIRMRDHGVTVSFIERMRQHGYTHLSADDLIRLRDHGF